LFWNLLWLRLFLDLNILVSLNFQSLVFFNILSFLFLISGFGGFWVLIIWSFGLIKGIKSSLESCHKFLHRRLHMIMKIFHFTIHFLHIILSFFNRLFSCFNFLEVLLRMLFLLYFHVLLFGSYQLTKNIRTVSASGAAILYRWNMFHINIFVFGVVFFER